MYGIQNKDPILIITYAFMSIHAWFYAQFSICHNIYFPIVISTEAATD